MRQDLKQDNQERRAKAWRFIKKNASSMAFAAFAVLMIFSPEAKSWVLRQFIATGIFNATMSSEKTATGQGQPIRFDYVDSLGKFENTGSLQGKVVFINFWASWCPPCRAEFPSIAELREKFKDNPDVCFLMINEDSDREKAIKYLSSHSYQFPLYRAAGKIPGDIYDGVLPTTLVLDKHGKVRFRHEGVANYASEKFINQIQNLADE
jgi:thiol-disulfide isomerase/thioredoxin